MKFEFRITAVEYDDDYHETVLIGTLQAGQIGGGDTLYVPTASGCFVSVITSMEGPGPEPPPFLAEKIGQAQLGIGVSGQPRERDICVPCVPEGSAERPEGLTLPSARTRPPYRDPETGIEYARKGHADRYRLDPRLRRLREELLRLPHRHQVAFAACCCDRLYPHYKRWVASNHIEDGLEPHIERLWQHVVGRELSGQECRQAETALEDLDLGENEGSLEFWNAIDAAGGVHAAYQACGPYAADHAATAAECAEETVHRPLWDQMTEGMASVGSEEMGRIRRRIDAHPLMKAERRRQQDQLRYLQKIKDLTPESVGRLREMDRRPA